MPHHHHENDDTVCINFLHLLNDPDALCEPNCGNSSEHSHDIPAATCNKHSIVIFEPSRPHMELSLGEVLPPANVPDTFLFTEALRMVDTEVLDIYKKYHRGPDVPVPLKEFVIEEISPRAPDPLA